MIARHAAVMMLLVGFAAVGSAQTRDAASAAAAAGTGTIAGTVVTDDDSARPVRLAIVTVNSNDPFVGRTAVTDDSGRFVFTSLPPGRYSVSASKRGWITSSYGAKTIGRPGRALQLAAGERATATLRIARGGVIAGTILDQFGQPVSGLSIRVMKYGYSVATGDRRLTPTPFSGSTPDERGAYRIYGLGPGDYYLSVSNPSVTFGGGRDLHLTSDVDVDEALKAAAQGPAVPATDVPEPNVGFTQIFYPGTASAAQATPITLRAGEERAGVDFTISYSPTARVEGTVTGPQGTPLAARVTLIVNDPTTPAMGIESIRNTSAGPDGRFTIAEIAPGPYLLSAQTSIPAASPEERPQILSATTDLDVQGEGAAGVSVVLQEGLTLSGVITYDGAPPAPNFSSVRVSLRPAQSGTVSISTAATTTGADGRFTLNGVAPGRYRLTVGQPSPQVRWRVRSATVLGQDALDADVEVRQNVTDAVIALSDRHSELTGKVEAPAGASADYTMILFSADRAQWRPQSRRILPARVASDGSFSFPNVPPGEYQLAPVDDVEPGEWFDPAFLQRLLPGALPVTIGEGEQKVQNVRVGGG